MNYGKLIVLIFSALTVVPLAFLIVSAVVAFSLGENYETTILGKLTDLKH